jgi:hypothetical protein
MRSYAQVSGALFVVLAAAQLTRTLMRWPVHVADVAIPLWASGFAFIIASVLAVWAFRTARSAA